MKWILLLLAVLFVSSCNTQRIRYVTDENGLENDIFIINDILFSDTIMLEYFHVDSVTENTFFVDDKIRIGFQSSSLLKHAKYRAKTDSINDLKSIYLQIEKEHEIYQKKNEAIKLTENRNNISKESSSIMIEYWFEKTDQLYIVEFTKLLKKPGYSRGFLFFVQKEADNFSVIHKSFWTE